jgi:pimeloyl-ACP methyl ester carboxylesterase
MKLALIVLVAAVCLGACAGQLAQTETTPAAADGGIAVVRAHAQVRDIQIYYEVHGQGGEVPLVLLPGGGSTIDVTYRHVLPLFARQRKVIAIEEQNHGRSGHRNQPERFTDSADDVAAVLAHLGIQKADVMGFSNGASVAMHVALRHRGLVRKLVFAASMTKKSGAPAQFWEMMSHATFADMPQFLKDAHLEVDPDPEHLRDMHDKDAERMRNFVDTPDEDVKSLDIPTLVLINDHDVPTLAHAIELSTLLPKADLIVLPGTHGAFLGGEGPAQPGSQYAQASVLLIQGFLNGVY